VVETEVGGAARIAEVFPEGRYRDVPGLCCVATREKIAAQDWSLHPGRYVAVAPGQKQDDEEFRMKLASLQEELEELNAEAVQLQARIAQNVSELLEA
jgi:type I restriction enzyme M protein